MDDTMADITIRNLDDGLRRRLRIRAAEHGRSMEEETREIFREAIGMPTAPKDLGKVIHRRFVAAIRDAMASRRPCNRIDHAHLADVASGRRKRTRERT